jgi:glycosyltransferase involved in cell wall biosynthesis
MESRPQVSVVVPVHNAAGLLSAQLTALAGQESSRLFEVIVVDNQSVDRSGEVALTFVNKLPRLQVLRAEDGLGVAYARNVGTRAAQGDYVLYCDADDEVRDGWLSALALALEKHELVGGILAVDRLNSVKSRSWVAAPPNSELPTTMRFLPYATGANLGVRRALWEHLGGFDEGYRGGHEEVDFAWRAQLNGATLGLAQDAVVDYRLRDDLGGAMRQRFGYGRSYAQLYAKFREQPITRASARHELKVIGGFLLSGPRELLLGNREQWLVGLAWTLGRWCGGLAYRVRCPL